MQLTWYNATEFIIAKIKGEAFIGCRIYVCVTILCNNIEYACLWQFIALSGGFICKTNLLYRLTCYYSTRGRNTFKCVLQNVTQYNRILYYISLSYDYVSVVAMTKIDFMRLLYDNWNAYVIYCDCIFPVSCGFMRRGTELF